MKLTKIEWKFYQPDHNCRCIICNGGQAGFVAHVGNWQLPVCPDCGKLTESEILKRITGGQSNETIQRDV